MRCLPTWLWRLRSPMTCCLPAEAQDSRGGVLVQTSKARGPGNPVIWVWKELSTWRPRAEKEDDPAQEESRCTCLQLFAPLGPQWVRGEADPSRGEGSLDPDLKLLFLPETFSQKPPDIMFHQLPAQTLSPIKLMHQIIHHNVCCENGLIFHIPRIAIFT